MNKLAETSNLYDENYFAHNCGREYIRDDHWLNFFGAIAGKIVAGVQPKTVLDAGCAMGFLVEQLRARGVEAWGVDISEYAIGKAHESIRDYVWVGSVTEPFPRKYDLIVTVDTADLALFGTLYKEHVDMFGDIPVLNIDHHISNTQFGQLHLIDPTAASATEVLYSWFMQVQEFREKITPDMATLLLTGLITDTRSFQNPNTTPRSLEVAAELLEKGARHCRECVCRLGRTTRRV